MTQAPDASFRTWSERSKANSMQCRIAFDTQLKISLKRRTTRHTESGLGKFCFRLVEDSTNFQELRRKLQPMQSQIILDTNESCTNV